MLIFLLIVMELSHKANFLNLRTWCNSDISTDSRGHTSPIDEQGNPRVTGSGSQSLMVLLSGLMNQDAGRV